MASRAACHCTTTEGEASLPAGLRVALVGSPNVGKSALFNRLTGRYVTVSNYPGTSVEVSRGSGRIRGEAVEILDTPGMYSLLATTEEERVARRIVLQGGADVLVHVVDAKNVARMLPLTLQLAETGRPLVLALNMSDEAERLGVLVDAAALSERLGIDVVPLVAIEGRGVPELLEAVVGAVGRVPRLPQYADGVGSAIAALTDRLADVYPVAPEAFAALLLQGDAEVSGQVLELEGEAGPEVLRSALVAAEGLGAQPVYRVAVERQRVAEELLRGVVRTGDALARRRAELLGRMLTSPWTGVPVLLAVLYLGLYKFVGQFGAGTIVNWLEGVLFARYVNPWLNGAFAGVPWPWLRDLFVGDYGVLTLGVRYAVAIVLPVVGSFFLFFSVLEDSGYFPRLALLVDRVFKRLGLSGRAVIPMVLGFACDTMATMVTRTLETRRERVLATLLLALAIPCSAQLGVILAVMAGHPAALAVWSVVLLLTLLLVGAISARILPGEAPAFHMELPPLRVPRLSNVLVKTYTRMHWYFLEVLPLFLFASVLMWVGKLTGLFDLAIRALSPVVGALGLPRETAAIFLFGFFRRDYGAAGLYEMARRGTLSTAQITVAAVTLTLFVPCIAQFLMMIRERGRKTAIGMFAFITPFAFGAGWLLHIVLRSMGW